MSEGGTRAGNTSPPSALAGVAPGPGIVAACDALEHEFTVASAVIKARGDADKTREGVAKAMGTTQAVVARLESGETMPSTSTLSASPRRPVPACGFGLSRRSRASPRRKPADHRMKTSRSRSRRRRKRRKFRPTWSSRGSEASFASKLGNEKTLIFQWPIFVTKILVLGEGSREPTFDGPSEGRLVNCYDVSSV